MFILKKTDLVIIDSKSGIYDLKKEEVTYTVATETTLTKMTFTIQRLPDSFATNSSFKPVYESSVPGPMRPEVSNYPSFPFKYF